VPSNVVGAGTLDPVAALTWELPAANHDAAPVKHVAAPPEPAPQSPMPRIVAFAGTAALILAVVAAAAIAARRRKELTQ
jgi:membrane-anchored mycosin MYCP